MLPTNIITTAIQTGKKTFVTKKINWYMLCRIVNIMKNAFGRITICY
jgi:hypothetical protein